MINGEKIQEDESGLMEQRLYHLDRILFGSNTILVFKYPLLKRKVQEMKEQINSMTPGLEDEELEKEARAMIVRKGLISDSDVQEAQNEAASEDSKDNEDDLFKKLMTVHDYSEEEVEQDIAQVDWDFAYNEILKIEQRKKDKHEMEAAKKWQEEMKRVEQEHREKMEAMQQDVIKQMQQKEKEAEELKLEMEKQLSAASS